MIAQMLKTNFDVTCFTYGELSCFLDYICRFLARLRRLFNECVTIECGRIYIAKQLEGMVRGEDALIDSPIKLYDICAALEALD